jgi:hypothetical protein
MTNWVAEIATSSNQKSVELLAMTDLDSYFHPHLILLSSMRVYPENLYAGMINQAPTKELKT